MRWLLAGSLLLGALTGCWAGGGGGAAGGPRPAPAAAAPAPATPSQAAPAAPREAQRVVVGVPTASLSYLPAQIAWKFGYFEQEGLAPEFPQMGGNTFIPALLGGQIDFTTNLSSIGAHAGNGGPTKIVQWHSVRLQHVVTARPDITTPQQLEGKRIGVGALGTLPAFQVQKLTEYYGLHDVSPVVVGGGGAEAIAAIEAGAADAAILAVPANLVAEQRGLPTLLRVGTVLEIPQAGLGTTDAHLREQPELVARTLRAAARAIPAIRERRDEVIALIAEWQELSAADAARAYELVVDTYSPNGLATDAQLAAYLELMRASANVPADATPDRLYDFTVARRVASELGLPGP